MSGLILVIEDEVDLATTLEYNLTAEGFHVRLAHDGRQGIAAATTDPLPDVIVLDLMLPDLSGTEICRRLREGDRTRDIPVIMCTAKGEEIDRVVGLKVGADDYVAKPFSRPELLARIEAVLRRHRREADEPERRDQLTFDRIAIDVARREVRVDEEEIHLTTKEFDLLAHMASSPGRIFTRDQLLARIWGYDYVGDGRTVDVHVSWLRGKLRGPDGHNYFRTVRGVGYAFTPRPV
jgi:two-component system, OmpR family, phosphate regulon response regulator PhoB